MFVSEAANYRIVDGGGLMAIEELTGEKCREQEVFVVRSAAGQREGKSPELAETVGDGGR